jgi:hypothetical protein
MSTIPTEKQQPTRSQNIALQRLAAGRDEMILLSHLLQASLVVERNNNPLRQAMIAHPHLVRNATVGIVILLSVVIGVLAPEISRSLRPY